MNVIKLKSVTAIASRQLVWLVGWLATLTLARGCSEKVPQ